MKAAVYALYGLFVMYFCCILCMWKNIKITIAVLKTTSYIVFHNIRILFIPLVESIVVVTWTFIWLYLFIMFISTAKITQPTKGA